MPALPRFDIAIVGAGPAGARAAWRLAGAGARVVMLDPSHPREKACGGGLTGRALDLVASATSLARLPLVAIDRASFEDGTATASIPIAPGADGRPRLAVIARRILDEALVAAATTAGATLLPLRVERIEREGGGWIVGSRAESVRADWLLGADGPASFVRRTVHRPFARRDLSIATGFYVPGYSSSGVSLAFEARPPGYLWSFPRHDHLAVGVCAQADDSSPAVLLPVVSRWIARHVGADAPLERYSWPIPSLGTEALGGEPPSGPEWMLLGDAGGMVDPITREGIYFALAAGDAAADSLQRGRLAGREYEARIRDTIHPELLRAAALKARFFQPRFTALLMEALVASGAIRRIMADLIAGVQPYHGLRRRLVRTGEVRLGIRALARLYR
ncbi:MAG: geranylgeranyl reductase family protein [Acidobacteriota bacterium]